MKFTPEQAADILHQIQQNQWKWVKVKRFVPEAHTGLNERYAALERHHTEETGRMIEVIQGLCETVGGLAACTTEDSPAQRED
ncbi:MAG: hypothetical protein JWP03_1387 [Phycisphaerales bacterium]|jgi:hypothetical protein|nr:hypothetical protein [Phycisphaerales bacterium]